MIPPTSVPVPGRENAGEHATFGSYNPSESVLRLELDSSPPSRIGDCEFSEGTESSLEWYRRSNSAKYSSSFPGGGFNLSTVKQSENVAGVEAKNKLTEKIEVQKEQASSSKPLKAKTTKAERRALQESQRLAKTASKDCSHKCARYRVRDSEGVPVDIGLPHFCKRKSRSSSHRFIKESFF